jgi:hypothetical protein
MASPARTNRTSPATASTASLTGSVNDSRDDFSAYSMRPVIRDFKLLAQLFASNGDIVLICGKGNQDKQGMLLVSYEIPPTTASAQIRLLKVAKLSQKSLTQLETVPVLKLALLLADGIVSLLDIDSLAEIATVSMNNTTLFATW